MKTQVHASLHSTAAVRPLRQTKRAHVQPRRTLNRQSRRHGGRASPVASASHTLVASESHSSSLHGEDRLLQTAYPLAISWAGAGIFFFWQLGAAKYLMEIYDLTKVPMAGASGGALAAVLCGCNVCPDRAFESAYELSIKHQIWTRPLGLVGIWGSLIEQWLDDLLPENAAELCRGRISIVVTALPKCEQVAYNDFKDKQDLINIAMTSSHVPFFLDGKLGRWCRGTYALDGSFPDFFTGDNSHFLVQGGRTLMFDYFEDPELQRKGRMEFLELKAHDEIERIMNLGYEYARRLHEEGAVSHFDANFCKRVMMDSA